MNCFLQRLQVRRGQQDCRRVSMAGDLVISCVLSASSTKAESLSLASLSGTVLVPRL